MKSRLGVFAVTETKRVMLPPVSLIAAEDFGNWTTPGGKPVGAGWEIVDGALHRKSGGGDIITKEEYGDFRLDFTVGDKMYVSSNIQYRQDR